MTNTVTDTDRARREYFTRSPDRPSGRSIRHDKRPTELIRAKSRLQTVARRMSLDDRKRPEAYTRRGLAASREPPGPGRPHQSRDSPANLK